MSPPFRPYTSLTDRQSRLPEQGRIRLGIQVKGRGGIFYPKAISTLRFTSPRREDCEAVAAVLGGEPKEWTNVRSTEWEVLTPASEIQVVLARNPLGDTPIYELWTKGGLERRCDGQTAAVPHSVGDEVELIEVPCICNARQEATCKVTTRLSVILPQVRFGGTWRLETHSWAAADELPGMVAAIEAFAARAGFVRAFLGVRREERMEKGKKSQWTVPYLRLDESVDQVLAGGGAVAALAVRSATPEDHAAAAFAAPGAEAGDDQRPPEAAGPAPGESYEPSSDDDEVVDAEVVEQTEVVEQAEQAVQPALVNDTEMPLGRVARALGLSDAEVWAALWSTVQSQHPAMDKAEVTARATTALARADLGTHRIEIRDGVASLHRNLPTPAR